MMKKSISIALCVMMFISAVVLNIHQDKAYAKGRDISNDTVKRLTVNNENPKDGDRIQVKLEFEGNKNGQKNIKKYDEISIGWTDTGNAVFEGFEAQKELTIQNKKVGIATVTKKGATIVFNDAIENLENVEGYLEFELNARNFINSVNDNTATGEVKSGRISKNINIKKRAAGKSGVFYYKSGRMEQSADKIKWWLNANTNKEYVSGDIVIKDQVQKGHKIDVDSFETLFRGSIEEAFKGREGIESLKNRYGVEIKINESLQSIEIRIPNGYASTNNFVFSYDTNITDDKQEIFENKSQAWYAVHNGEKSDGEDFNFSILNLKFAAGITGTIKGELKILKTVKNTAVGIKGVTFQIKKQDGSDIRNGEKSISITTDEKGIADIRDLPHGKYEVVEIDAPNWIAFDASKAEKRNFEIKIDDLKGTFYHIENEKKKVDINVLKTWSRGEEADEVEILLLGNGKVVKGKSVSKRENWMAEFKNLPECDDSGKEIEYTVSEITKEFDTPKGDNKIVINNKTYEVNIRVDEKNKYNFIIDNKYMPKNPMIPLSPAKKSIKVSKKWVGIEQDKAADVKVYLYKNGVNTNKYIMLGKENGWRGEFKDLPTVESIYDEKEIAYSVVEEALEGFETKIEGNDKIGFTIFNKKIISPKPELPKEIKPIKPTEPHKTKVQKKYEVDKSIKKSAKSPKTGDSSNIYMHAVIIYLAIAVAIFIRLREKN